MNRRTIRQARRSGRRDGEQEIPAADESAYPPAVHGLVEQAEAALGGLTERWSATDGGLKSEHTSLAQSIQSRKVMGPRRRTDLTALRTRTSKRVGELRRERQALQERASGLHIPFWLYAVAIAVVFSAEFPLNAIAFQLFGEAQLLTWFVTGALALTLVAVAHFAGAAVRGSRTIKERRLLVVGLVVAMVALLAVSVLRQSVIERGGEAFDLLGPAIGIFAFLAINLLIFFATVVLSYMAHDPAVPELRRVDAEIGDLGAALAAAEAGVRVDAAALEREQQRYPATQVEREKLFEATRAQAERLTHQHRDLIAAYWQANLLARRDGATPPASSALPEVPIPRRLEKQLDPPRQLVADVTEERGDA